MLPAHKSHATLTQNFGLDRARATPRAEAGGSEPEPADDESGAEGAQRSRHHRNLPEVGELVGGLYRLIRLLGEGMFGRVYVAERTDVPEHKVALKVMARAAYAGRNVERELVMLAAASHPHIVQLKDHGMTEHYVWLTMPLFEGETLASRLERGPLGLREAHDIFLCVGQAVEALHAAGLRHQDIKPENIYLARFADLVHPMLLDLGVAVEHNATFVAGTVAYAAPEQVMALGGMQDAPPLSAKIDTYGLGCTLLRALVGAEHYPGECSETPFEIASAFIERENEPLRAGALPELVGRPRKLLGDALRGWLSYRPEDRPSSGKFAEQLAVLLEQERELDAAIARRQARQKASLQRVRISLGAMILLGAGVAAYGYSKRETLRLAAELERVRSEGAASFDKLDTCVAAHSLTKRDATQCNAGWQRDKQDFKAALDELSDKGSKAQSALARRIFNYTTRLRGCEEDAHKAADTWTAEKDGLERNIKARQEAWDAERTALLRARDERDEQARACQRTQSELGAARDECREDLASCIEDRDTCLNAVQVAQSQPRPRPSEPKPSAPAARPSEPAPAVEPSPTEPGAPKATPASVTTPNSPAGPSK
jgi:eukaryotic-like serine/threonine-protein kinase